MNIEQFAYIRTSGKFPCNELLLEHHDNEYDAKTRIIVNNIAGKEREKQKQQQQQQMKQKRDKRREMK